MIKDDLAGGRLPSGLFGANAACGGDHGFSPTISTR